MIFNREISKELAKFMAKMFVVLSVQLTFSDSAWVSQMTKQPYVAKATPHTFITAAHTHAHRYEQG